jgi:hypothetical protein
LSWILNKNQLRWVRRYNELVVCIKRNGHCNVPFVYKHNVQLSMWVHWQRTQYEEGVLLGERTELLDELGFIWNRNEESEAVDA